MPGRQRVGGLDDPIWAQAPAAAMVTPAPDGRAPARESVRLRGLRACVVGSWGLALSMVALPWYGYGDGGSRWGLRIGFNAFLPWPTTIAPGGQGFAFLILGTAGAVVVLAVVTAHAVRPRRTDHRTAGGGLLAGLAIAATALPVLVLAEAQARPPYGDGPPLRYDWGAVVGVFAAFWVALGAGWALAAWGRERRSRAEGRRELTLDGM